MAVMSEAELVMEQYVEIQAKISDILCDGEQRLNPSEVNKCQRSEEYSTIYSEPLWVQHVQ